MALPDWTIRHPGRTDWDGFLALADAEGWEVPSREIALFRGVFAKGAWAARSRGRLVGFVTTAAYRRTGWMGNLLVAPEFRGRGMGRRLFERALRDLHRRNLEELWLTASPAGKRIYHHRGFRKVDTIQRWLRTKGDVDPVTRDTADDELDFLDRADQHHWRDQRLSLLKGISAAARVFRAGRTVVMLQDGGSRHVLGPWYSPDLCPRENRLVLAAALESARQDVVLDVLESSPAGRLLAAAGFQRLGRTELMVRSENCPDLRGIVSLASLGSIG